MHEWAFAEGILKSVEDESNKEGFKRLSKVVIVLGELQSIDREIVSFAIDNLKNGTVAENAEFIFKDEPVEFKCRVCGRVWQLGDIDENVDELIRESIHFVPEAAHTFISCPDCSSKDFEIVKGRGIYISHLEGEA